MSTHYRTFVVRRLDGVDQDVAIDKKANGMDLLEKVFAWLRVYNLQQECMQLP